MPTFTWTQIGRSENVSVHCHSCGTQFSAGARTIQIDVNRHECNISKPRRSNRRRSGR